MIKGGGELENSRGNIIGRKILRKYFPEENA